MGSEYLESNEKILKELCNRGLKGEYELIPNQIAFPLTNKCNNYCIMCHACDKKYENHTYYNDIPFEVSLKQYKRILPLPSRTILDKILNKNKTYEESIEFVFGSAETLLNQDIYKILKYTKDIYPNCVIRLISNGTIPPNPPDIVKYIDRIGFSVDGCTEETYNYLRTPAKFSHAMDTIRRWDDAASKYNVKFSFGFGTVLSSVNINQLAGIIKLASSFKHMDSVYVQPIILHESKKHLENLLLKNVSSDILRKYINEAKAVSDEVGVRIDGLSSIDNSTIKTDIKENGSLDFENSRYCRYMWNKIISFNDKGEFKYLCCYMSVDKGNELINKYNIPKNGSPREIYNSNEFWNLRKDMLSGILTEYCKGCNLCNNGYNLLSTKKVNFDNSFYV